MNGKQILKVFVCFSVCVVLPVNAQPSSPFEDDFDTYATSIPPVPPWTEFYAGPGSTPKYTREDVQRGKW